MSIERKATRVLEQAKILAEKAESWVDFSNALFGLDGLVSRAFPSEIERKAFFDSRQYKEVQMALTDLMRRVGVTAGGKPKEKSGRFVVRVPKTIHQKLDIEAKRESVSLNQLAVAKLAIPLPRATDVVRSAVIQAFNATHKGHSRDWVIIEPTLDRNFLDRCRELGLRSPEYSDYFLNHLLMGTSKTSKYKGQLNPTTARSSFPSYDDCAFASEIAIRVLQRTDGVTLDRTLCDPPLLARFDAYAMALAPSQAPLKLRAAALNLRKTHRLKPMEFTSDEYDLIAAGPVKRVSLSEIVALPGGYVFYDQTRPIYAGETDNLRRRVELHLSGGLPDWLGVTEDDDFILKVLVLPKASREDRLKWLGAFINRERPLLNYQKVA
jgi:hypothetical protein